MSEQNKEEAKGEVEVAEQPAEEEAEEEKPKGPTVFQALRMKQNRNVLNMFIFISVLLVVTAFGTFKLGSIYIPYVFPTIDPFDAPGYACGAAVVVTQIIIFVFYFWAWKHDVAEEKAEIEEEKRQKEQFLAKAKSE